ncbi:Uncharacterised protein [Mycobacterium tuberculosis]|nr:Uncharacterised protein [Mycobacterium tuberculosis]
MIAVVDPEGIVDLFNVGIDRGPSEIKHPSLDQSDSSNNLGIGFVEKETNPKVLDQFAGFVIALHDALFIKNGFEN